MSPVTVGILFDLAPSLVFALAILNLWVENKALRASLDETHRARVRDLKEILTALPKREGGGS